MEQTIVLKARLYTTVKQSQQFRDLTTNYAQACNYASRIYHEHGASLNQIAFHDQTYYYIRQMYGLKAQEASSVPKTVMARYQSINTQLRQNIYKFQDTSTKRWYRQFKTVQDLWYPIRFRRPQADLVRKNDWSIVGDYLSINTLKKRTKCAYYLPKYYRNYLTYPHKLGTAKLVAKGGHWYLHISCTLTLPNFSRKSNDELVGIDRGLRQLYYAYDSRGRSTNWNAQRITKQRRHFLKQRRILQSKGTTSAKRKLRQLSGRENRWMTQVNHQVSKALVRIYGKRTTFVLEDLKGVRFSTEQVTKKHRYTQVSWSFYQLEQFLTYKAHLNQSEIIKVSPRYTSQRCPQCGNVSADNRHHDIHTYICQTCDYRSNDDRIGGMNLRCLGRLIQSGYDNPQIQSNSSISYQTTIHPRSKKTGRRLQRTQKQTAYLNTADALALG